MDATPSMPAATAAQQSELNQQNFPSQRIGRHTEGYPGKHNQGTKPPVGNPKSSFETRAVQWVGQQERRDGSGKDGTDSSSE